MDFSLSTNWLSTRLASGEAIADTISGLGFASAELGYLLTDDQAEGIRRRVQADVLRIGSVHAYCPVPLGAPYGYPELYAPASPDEDERALAVLHLLRTLACAEQFGARRVVCHAGRVRLRRFGLRYTSQLMRTAHEGGTADATYAKLLRRERALRARGSPAVFEGLCRALDVLLPRFEKAGVMLCLENLPSLEAFPDADEFARLKVRYATPALGYWHDIGHGEVRKRFGWDDPVENARRLLPVTGGIHIHDVSGLDNDHQAPGQGSVDFNMLAFYGTGDIERVFEPAAGVTEDAVRAGLAKIRVAWEKTP